MPDPDSVEDIQTDGTAARGEGSDGTSVQIDGQNKAMSPNGRLDREAIEVLLVEDSPDQVELLRRLLQAQRNYGFRLHHTGTLYEGLRYLESNLVDVILVDLILPDSEGLNTFLRIIEAANEIPVVVLSGINDTSLALETMQLGAQDYLVKGHLGDDLLPRSLQYAVERKRVQLELKRANAELERRVQERTAALRETNQRLQREIADRRQAEEATRESNRQLECALEQLRAAQQEVVHRERMQALGRMANGIAHDFNNSLAPIVGMSELLLRRPELLADTATARSYLEKIHLSAKASARAVSRLRDFYRFRDDKEVLGPVVINDVIQQAVSIAQPRWRDEALASGVNIEIRTEFGVVPSVPGDEAEIKQAIVNLLLNAADAIPKRGTITIRSEVQGRWATISVIDDGVGMSEDVLARCLEPFYSTRKDQGTGLGLGAVYGAVRRHEGNIDIQSELGKGTTVSLFLPIEPESEAPEKPEPDPSQLRPLRVLVVEDEPLVREVLAVYLSEDAHEIVTAENGREGLERFRNETFDLVLTDRAMPEMNGDELAREIKKLKPNQGVILLTGFGDLMTGAGEQPEGVDLVVSKPFTLTGLRTAISKVMNG